MILWQRDVRAKVSTVATGSSRICVLQVCFGDIKLLLVAVDGNSRTDEFTSELSIIEDVIGRHPGFNIILGGDFNVDFSRDR